jgi:signal transduction histidine kinase
MTAEDGVRRRIAKELHDSTAQDLVAVMMNMELLRESEAGLDPAVAKQIDDSLALLENCAHEIRTLSYVLHPPGLDEAGLAGAIRHFVAGFGERTGLATSVDLLPDLGRLGETVEMILFRVVQESLSNIHRHSQSMTAAVRIGRRASEVILEIKDQGRGIPRQILEAGTGHSPGLGVGIPGMRERLRQIGGRLDIESGPIGTTVRATVPWTRVSS